MKVYVSGPITGTENYFERFMNACREIEAAGNEAINPAPLGYVLPASATHEDFMNVCLPLVDMADCIYMLEGWENSKGAKLEMERAIKCRKMIVFETSTF